MKKNVEQTKLEKRYARLTDRFGKLGPILQGTITERNIRRPDPDNSSKTKVWGPYYQWTFKRAAKTVTVNLSKEQARVYQRAIDNHRKLESIIKEMREISEKILEEKTVGVKRRK